MHPYIQPIPKQNANQQLSDFTNLLQKLGKSSPTEIEVALSEREPVQPEKELTTEIMVQFQKQKNKDAKHPCLRDKGCFAPLSK